MDKVRKTTVKRRGIAKKMFSLLLAFLVTCSTLPLGGISVQAAAPDKDVALILLKETGFSAGAETIVTVTEAGLPQTIEGPIVQGYMPYSYGSHTVIFKDGVKKSDGYNVVSDIKAQIVGFEDSSFNISEIVVRYKKITPVNSIQIGGNASVGLGTTVKYNVSSLPLDATYSEVDWTVNDSNIAEIDKEGNLTAKAHGVVIITATAKDRHGATGITRVTVGKKVDSLTISSSKDRILQGDSLQMSSVIAPADAGYQKCFWSIQDAVTKVLPTYAAISQDGILTTTGPGTVIVSAAALDGSKITASKTISIIQLATAVQINGSDTVKMGEMLSLSASVLPENASDKSVQWSVDNSSLAVIDQDGKLTPKAEGMVKVTAVTKDGSNLSAEKTIAIQPAPPMNIEFSSGNYKYKTINNALSGIKTAMVTGFSKGKAVSKVTIGKTIKYNGVTYQITEIGEKAFYKNTKIKQVDISNNVTVIGKNAFKYCKNLTEVKLGNKVTTIKDSAFNRCSKLKKVTIGTGLKEIKAHVFCGDTKMTSLTIKSTKLSKVGKHNLSSCQNLKIRVNSKKVSAYSKLFKNQGQKKNVKVTK